jgi:hypothetical protein
MFSLSWRPNCSPPCKQQIIVRGGGLASLEQGGVETLIMQHKNALETSDIVEIVAAGHEKKLIWKLRTFR